MNTIYGYTHDGLGPSWIKVGQTRGTGIKRVKEQLRTVYPKLEGVQVLFLDKPAIRPDGTEFQDHDVHRLMKSRGVPLRGEFVQATQAQVEAAIVSLQTGNPYDELRTKTFALRPEQAEAVEKTAAYFRAHEDESQQLRFLWNAKMRFGKTFTSYQLAKKMGWKRILVLTYKPAVAGQWKTDLLTHADFHGWDFVDRATPEEAREDARASNSPSVWFASFQDVTGRGPDGLIKKHNEVLHRIEWDAVILDEYHFGAWRDAARELYQDAGRDRVLSAGPDDLEDQSDVDEVLGHLMTKHVLHLSGTPFRALMEGEFTEDAIYNWRYVDEQKSKYEWDYGSDDEPIPNPYAGLPDMHLYSYDMGLDKSDHISELLGDDDSDKRFTLNKFFEAESGSKVFKRPSDVAMFLDVLRGIGVEIEPGERPCFPYSHPIFAGAIRHSVWYLPTIAACRAMKELLEDHAYFRHFDVVVVAGNANRPGRDQEKVEETIRKSGTNGKKGTITLTCGKLMTGVTVKEWGAILMLRSLESPESYFQAAFRVQSEWSEPKQGEPGIEIRKENCYVFEFDPERALRLLASYAHQLSTKTREITARDAIKELTEYLPVHAFKDGSMVKLDESSILEWAYAGIGASALANKWNSAHLVTIDIDILRSVLDDESLLAELDHLEVFRELKTVARKAVDTHAKTKKARQAKDAGEDVDDEGLSEERAAATKQVKELRKKLRSLITRVPIFMYATDHSEAELRHLVGSKDGALFERFTGFSLASFGKLTEHGVFPAANIEAAIMAFKRYEQESLQYVLTEEEWARQKKHRDEIWSRLVGGRIT